jgi:hypothetical protein
LVDVVRHRRHGARSRDVDKQTLFTEDGELLPALEDRHALEDEAGDGELERLLGRAGGGGGGAEGEGEVLDVETGGDAEFI